MTRHLRDLPGRLRPFLTAFCVMGAALFFALVAFANRDDAGGRTTQRRVRPPAARCARGCRQACGYARDAAR